MPVRNCSENGKPGYKWGDTGKCYVYTSNDPKSRERALTQARAQGLAARLNGYEEKSMPEPELEISLEDIQKSLDEWFRENWVDLSRPKPGGGFEPCGRADASTGKYPKCVPASRAARMTPEQIRSAIQRKRRAESTQRREDKKPIYVSTEKAMKNVPTNPALYARVKAEAKRKFDVYPSAYANAWLVREYKRRGGGYRTVNKSIDFSKVAEDLAEEEAMLAQVLIAIARRYGKFDEDGTGIWAGYEPAEENDDAEIGVKCANCVLYEGDGVCKVIAQQVEDNGKCRFAVIPDGVVQMESEMEEEDEMEDETEDEMGNAVESENEEEDDMEEEDSTESDLSPIQQAQYEALEQIVEVHGKWDQSAKANGAHYAPADKNPFVKQGMICANCVFYEGGRGCEIVSGEIEPNAICKLWIIHEKYIQE